MSVHAATTSPYSHTSPRLPRSTTTPALRSPHPASIGQTMTAPIRTPGPSTTTTATNKIRSPSPNYFGFQISSSNLPISAYDGQNNRRNWSPPSSAVRSAAALSPTYVPVEHNPDYAAFRKQSEGAGRTFSLSGLSGFPYNTTPVSPKFTGLEQQENVQTVQHQDKSNSPPTRPSLATLDPELGNTMRSPKRHLSSDSTNFPPAVRKASPAIFQSIEPSMPISQSPQSILHQPPKFNLPPPSNLAIKHRAETVPTTTNNSSDEVLVTPQHVVTLLESGSEDMLLLDLRVSTLYAKSRISGALSLCIPTTLMKRPSFNVQKLAETFKSDDQRSKFEAWRTSKYIIVYDASASQLKDAAICLNTIKKFESEGYQGNLYIIRGGFNEFARRFPQYIDKQASQAPGATPTRITMPGTDEPLPVIGGCPMPAGLTKSAANPFFGNIRQNMDLIGGVGQMDVKRPSQMTRETSRSLPAWIRNASAVDDKGEAVSQKFLHIEQKEQKRMQEALSGQVHYGTPGGQTASSIQIAGIEKGSKNRYNNIWPFEHSRVKLEDVPTSGCDYFNANHVTSSLSNKRYIATQGPIPTTFNDFWNVIWQQDVRVIVMLTAEKEGGQVKAHDYWSDRRYGPFSLEQIADRKATLDPVKIARHKSRHASRRTSGNKLDMGRADSGQDVADASLPGPLQAQPTGEEPYVKVRKFTLRHDGFPFEPLREITHIQYASWPDFGAPAHPTHLLGLVEQTDAVVRSVNDVRHAEPDPPSSRPVVVHCSAGCGRTGTFCTVDSVIDMIKRQRLSRLAKAQPDHSPISSDNVLSSPTSRQSVLSHEDMHSDNPFFTSSPIKEDTSASSVPEMNNAWLNDDSIDLIEKTVEDFRHQRLSMVQSLRQFVLCYETVLEWLVEEQRREEEGATL